MIQKTEKEKALIKAQEICAKQEKCKADIRKKLFEWKVDTNDHSWILEQLENENFIDEKRYAGFFVRDKFKFNKWGKIKIEFELRAKQINSDTIRESINLIDLSEYKNTCKALLNQKLRGLRDEEPSKIKEKLLRFGHSRGFEPELLFKLLENMLDLNKRREN
jgi:regulatory protein